MLSLLTLIGLSVGSVSVNLNAAASVFLSFFSSLPLSVSGIAVQWFTATSFSCVGNMSYNAGSTSLVTPENNKPTGAEQPVHFICFCLPHTIFLFFPPLFYLSIPFLSHTLSLTLSFSDLSFLDILLRATLKE